MFKFILVLIMLLFFLLQQRFLYRVLKLVESFLFLVNFRVLYEDFYCDEENNDIINVKIDLNVELFFEELFCRQKMMCNIIDFVIFNCGKELIRKKRFFGLLKMIVGFQVKFLCLVMICMLLNIDIIYRFYLQIFLKDNIYYINNC